MYSVFYCPSLDRLLVSNIDIDTFMANSQKSKELLPAAAAAAAAASEAAAAALAAVPAAPAVSRNCDIRTTKSKATFS